MRGMEVDYLYRSDSGWRAEPTGLSGQYYGVFPCLAYDTTATAMIAYCYNGYDSAGGILLGARTDSAWVVDTVTWAVPQSPYAHLFFTKRLGVDRFNVPHVFVENGSGMADAKPPWSYSLWTWVGRTGTWTDRYIAGGGFLEYVHPLDLSTDDSGREVVCYSFGNSSGDWLFECDSEALAESDVSDAAVRVDSLGRPHIAWVCGGALYYAYRTNFWHVESVPAGQNVGGCDLLLDTLGEPLVVYSSPDGVWLAHGVDVVGQSEEQRGPIACGSRLTASVIRNVLLLPGAPSSKPQAASCLLDAAGRRALDLHPGSNDVSRLAPGVYFVREAQAQAVRKVMVTR